MPEHFAVIGVDHAEGSAETWVADLHDMMKSFGNPVTSEFAEPAIDAKAWHELASRMTYVRGDFTTPRLYQEIAAALQKAERQHGTEGNVIFYLAVADRFFGTVIEQLGAAKLTVGPR